MQQEKPARTGGNVPEGFVSADSFEEVEAPDTFRLPGPLGDFIGDQQRYKLAIQLQGEPHAGKTQLLYQLVDLFATRYDKIAVLDLEQGGMESKDTRLAIERNVAPENRSSLFVKGELDGGLEELRSFAADFPVVAIDSIMELGIPAIQIKELRNEFPETIFIIISQLNQEGGTFGGVTADYISNVRIRVLKGNGGFESNYAEMLKNRGNEIGQRYFWLSRKLVKPEPQKLEGTSKPKYYSRTKKDFKRAGEAMMDVVASTGVKADNLKPAHTKVNWRWAYSPKS